MKSYLIRRLLLMIPVIFGVSVIIFTLISLAPGDPFAQMIEANPSMSRADYENLLNSIGYYDPIPVKYAKWAKQVFSGSLGYSISQKQPIADMIGRRLKNTLLLSIPALVLSTIIAIPLGVLSATKQYSFLDYILTLLALAGISIPAFFLALLLLKYLAFDLKLFPLQGMETIAAGYTGTRWLHDRLHHLALPLSILTTIQVAGRMRYTRSSMLEIINQDYIRTARAKGLGEKSVIYKHALRNALIPVITVLSISLGSLLSGAILTENVFMWPGMGTLVYQAISNRDYPLVMAGTMLLALSMLIANLLADIAYAFADPRIRYD
ncbi:MAG: ABC transporter permease [Firmicutes bacterium]|nr:ABC transporter permease [Bacillota bacterium]